MSAPPYGPPAGAVPPPEAPPKQGGARRGIGITLIVFGVLGAILTGLFGWYVFGNRAGTMNPAYEATMWRNEPADKLFPATIADFGQREVDERGNSTGGYVPTWLRAGIAQDTDCRSALTPFAYKVVNKYGCEAVLRATYVDRTNQHVATLALIVVKDPKKKVGEYTSMDMIDSALQERGVVPDPGEPRDFAVRAFPVAGTPAAQWNDAARNATYTEVSPDGYVTAATVGSVDGRQAGRLPAPWNEMGGNAPDTGDRATYLESAKGLVLGGGIGQGEED